MDMPPLTPGDDDRCKLCGQLLLPRWDSVLVYDDSGEASWWHMRCRDLMAPNLLDQETPSEDSS